MAAEPAVTQQFPGLNTADIAPLQRKYGKNVFKKDGSYNFLRIVVDTVKEPMFILLAVDCFLYFLLGEISEGIMMLVAIMIVSAISLYQEVKSSKALEALKAFAEPLVEVIRSGKQETIAAEELVPGDVMLLAEGMNVPADATVIEQNDLSVNEAVLTGESVPVNKSVDDINNTLFQGTTINGGKCVAIVTATGNNTALGKLGKMVAEYAPPKTLLQQQINAFVKRLAFFGLIAFTIIFLVNYLHYREWTASLLFALTLAMSALPEEIPVAFSSFMALGAYKMSKLGIISRQPAVVENLGAVTVLCFDKTGTLTENKMQVKVLYDYKTASEIEFNASITTGKDILFYGALASEKDPFDAMEKAIWQAYTSAGNEHNAAQMNMVNEFPLEGQPPMMTHLYAGQNGKIVAGKGAAERIVNACKLTADEQSAILQKVKSLALQGYRVIGVASAVYTDAQLPLKQDDFNWQFQGLIALFDPPKKNAAAILQQYYDAGIQVKLITGDYPETAMNIAQQVGINGTHTFLTGAVVQDMEDDLLQEKIKQIQVFARMFPEAKLKVVNALKANGDIVAMTGDGVNDGPALRSSNIGIAMGKKGTELAKEAADLILTDDNLEKITFAIKEGRKIFNNLKKAVRYIISIHVPIILTASLPVILGWKYPNIFTPIHVIFMELIMGPTCSIFFEREPTEPNIMQQPPRAKSNRLFNSAELMVSVLQGVVIAAGALCLYYYSMNNGETLEYTRTMVFTTLVISNLLLTFENRSFTKSIVVTSRYKNNLALPVFGVSVVFLLCMHFVPPVQNLFKLTAISSTAFLMCVAVAIVAVMWFELYKYITASKK